MWGMVGGIKETKDVRQSKLMMKDSTNDGERVNTRLFVFVSRKEKNRTEGQMEWTAEIRTVQRWRGEYYVWVAFVIMFSGEKPVSRVEKKGSGKDHCVITLHIGKEEDRWGRETHKEWVGGMVMKHEAWKWANLEAGKLLKCQIDQQEMQKTLSNRIVQENREDKERWGFVL